MHIPERQRVTAARLCMTLLLAALAGAAAAQQAASPAFVLGVLPNVSARVIATTYAPMQAYLQRELGRPVEVATAPDFRAFSGNTMKGQYHMVVTAPNLGRVNELDGRWEPVAIYEPAIPGLLVTAAGNPDASPAQLRGKILAVGNPQSLVVLRGLQWLREQGLQEGRDFRITRAGNEDSLAPLIRSGEAPFAMMSMGEFRNISEPVRKDLRIATEFARVPGFLVMLNPALSSEDRARVRSVVLRFPASPEGKAFFAQSGFADIRALKPGELAPLDAFTAITRAALRPPE